MKGLFLSIAAVMIVAPAVSNAEIILDWSPGTYDTADLRPSDSGNWSNLRDGQHFADSFTLAENAAIFAMDLYSGTSWGSVGDLVSIQLWADDGGTPGALLAEFIEDISLIDLEGARGDTNRKYVEFTDLLMLTGGTTYWIGMSGVTGQLAQLGLGGAGAPQDGGMAQFSGDSFSFMATTIGDMAFRLHAVPEPGTLALFALGVACIGFGRRRRLA